jgi:hypothetical protein
MTNQHPITPPPPHLLKKFSAQAQAEANKRNGTGYLKTVATLCIEWFVNSQSTSNDRQIRSSEITPPPEMVQQWMQDCYKSATKPDSYSDYIATQAARWGADQELEACTEWVRERKFDGDGDVWSWATSLRAARRPKPPSLKEQALAVLDDCANCLDGAHENTIRRALDASMTDPTDEEIMELMPQQMRDDLAAAARALAGFDRDNVKAAGAMRIILNRHAVDHARAALAKWGHQ